MLLTKFINFFEYKFLPDKQQDELKLPKWVNVSKERFNGILSTITEAKKDGLKTSVNGRETTLYKAEHLLKDLASGKIDVRRVQYC